MRFNAPLQLLRGRPEERFILEDVVPDVLPDVVTLGVSKIRRGGFVFVTWVGDHSPRHVHVYRDGSLIVKWDLDHWGAMEGSASRRILRLITELVEEGRL
ncbi:MAG: DUF4160 domain-containing protein [Acidimicrobiales bacterium]